MHHKTLTMLEAKTQFLHHNIFVYVALALACCVGQSIAQTEQIDSVQRGFRIITDQRLGNCMACHSMPDAQGKKLGVQSTFAPPLDGVARRYDTATIRQWLADARSINPDTMMPPFANNGLLNSDQIEDVLAALATLK